MIYRDFVDEIEIAAWGKLDRYWSGFVQCCSANLCSGGRFSFGIIKSIFEADRFATA